MKLLKFAALGCILTMASAAHAVCSQTTTANRIACLVTSTFADRHLASTSTGARTKTIALHRDSSFLKEDTATLSALQAAVSVSRSEANRLATFSCTYDTARPTNSACREVTQTVYFCANPRNTRNQVFHLDSDRNGTCTLRASSPPEPAKP